MVVIRPSFKPKESLMILAKGARQLVVQEALETISMEESYFLLLTPCDSNKVIKVVTRRRVSNYCSIDAKNGKQ